MPYPLLSFSPLQLLEGLMGSGLGTLGGLDGRRELGCLRLRLKLQTLMIFHESLQLLLHLADLNPKPLSLNTLLGRFLFGLSQRLLQGCHLGCVPYNKQYNHVISFLQSSLSRGTFFLVISYFPSPRAAVWQGRALARSARGPF